ncbi:type II toxin-antitoxin system RelE/ParE family toxin [Pseudomonas tensinigenes]|uniref:type II toxin-antitoxin system RelE/ParE family toxin n=1 Tax=Pseudomonas tensinigenes TaxID=2745511 RepID=UPI00346343D9
MDSLPLEWSDQALDDLADIIDYIEQHNSNASAALQRKVVQQRKGFHQFPLVTGPAECQALGKWWSIQTICWSIE